MTTARGITGHGALAGLALPGLGGLSEDQVRGRCCVWGADERLTAETAVDLGPRTTHRAGYPVTWYPRGCHAHVHRAALRALHEHAPYCEQCVDDASGCPTGVALRRLMREHREARPA
ncbi:hypothetical protein SZN_18707 [Streptomyces zinciresistens K42]|uniref:Uncharacterized protein n=1 Tax=Streptomyces zinciresistens K42 TaxID=700597 RepID=G2GE12_9ACTN|nr:hypothetical protein SZN_18707 [Streptomyces zinciresistens K42]